MVVGGGEPGEVGQRVVRSERNAFPRVLVAVVVATLRRIVDRNGGRIWAEGHVDQGATFSFTVTSGSRKEAT